MASGSGVEEVAEERQGQGERLFCEVVASVLAESSVLDCIRDLQRLDAWDIENIAPMHAFLASEQGSPPARSSRSRQGTQAAQTRPQSNKQPQISTVTETGEREGGVWVAGGAGGSEAREEMTCDAREEQEERERECRGRAPGGRLLPHVSHWHQCVQDFLVAQVTTCYPPLSRTYLGPMR